VAWVRIPVLSVTADTVFSMYYGNETMGSRQNPEGVWDDNYDAVYHMNQDPSSASVLDSTTNNYDLTAGPGFNSGDLVDGIIGKAILFDSSDYPSSEYLEMPSGFSNPTSALSLEMWFRPQLYSVFQRYFTATGARPDIRLEWDNRIMGRVKNHLGDTTEIALSFDGWEDQFYHLVITWEGGSVGRKRAYLNGTLKVDEFDSEALGNSSLWTAYTIGTDLDYTDVVNALIEEFRITSSVRTPGWFETEYNNQNDPSSFYSIGEEDHVIDHIPNAQYFAYYKDIIIDPSMVSGSQDLLNFPVLISIVDEDLHDDVQLNGNDIAFSNGFSWLDHETEFFDKSYNSSHAQLVVWVRIPNLSPSFDTVIRMYYGNSTMSSNENPSGVWNTNYKGVWHLKENPLTPTPQFSDSTAYNNDGTAVNLFSSNQTSGKIDGGLIFNDENEACVNVSDDNSLDLNSDMTISAWIKTNDNENDVDIVITKWSLNPPNQNYWLGKLDSNDFAFYVDANQDVKMNLNLIRDNNWHYVVGVADSTNSLLRIYLDGIQRNTASYSGSSQTGNHHLNIGKSSGIIEQEWNGKIDEVRVVDVAHSAAWIATEYNNQYNPQSFMTIGSEENVDNIPPTYTNLIESSDPLELGDTEVITINVSDPSGINQVKIEFKDSDHVIRNHTMTNISENVWQYDSWTPTIVDNYTYTIWMQDNFDNWNTTLGTIEVIDTTPPTYSDLIESADPLQIGQNETITIKVYDSLGSGVNQVLLEYDSSNHTMINIGGDTWRWDKWKPAKGNHSYTIYMEDMENNWNVTSGTITVVEATGPTIENFTMSEDPLELGNNVTISVDVYDNSSVHTVLIELESANYTMNYVAGNTYETTWTRSWVGTVIYVIYANDTLNNWNSFTGSFEVVDTTAPVIVNLNKSEDTLELGNTIIITVNSTDLSGIALALIEYEDSDHIVENHTMTNMTGDVWQYDSWTPGPPAGNWSYQIWVKDNNNNWGSVSDSVLVQDTTLPLYSDLTESSSIVELGTELTISIKCTDLAGIKEVAIEYDNFNHTMEDMGSNIWQYNLWMPNSIGNYTYKIYIADYNNNLNYTSSSILFQDTVIPEYSDLNEVADPLELGENQIISIDLFDFAGINQTLIEFEGVNYSMTQIDGNTWQYDSWTPNNRIIYQYRVYIEDKSGNWNFVIANFSVQDTISPSLPILANSPSGDVSGTLLFDWEDGYDPSGILYYILIIDTETDPYSTPGFVYYINITNIGSESSYHELSEVLPVGRYYYFLAQIDGAGHQSSFTMGTFNVVAANNLMIYIIIGIVMASAVGLVGTAVIVRKKTKKEILPYRKIISLKIITTHMNKLQKITPEGKFAQILPSKDLTAEKELENRINEIKSLGEELFTEGAYLEAQKQFKIGRDLLLSLEREEESNLFSELISGIEGLIEEREKRLEILEETRIEGNSEHVFNLYQEIIDISYKLRDPDSASYYQAELIQYFQNNNLLSVDLELHRMEVSHEAELSFSNNTFANAAQLYEKCEKISQLLVQLGRDEEVAKIEEFRRKKEESLKKIS
jgi:hypothetical protein